MWDQQALLDDGWRGYDDRSSTATYSFSKRFYGYPVCQANDRLWITLLVWEYLSYNSFELDLRGQTIHGDWVYFKIYSFSDQSEIPEKCDRLLNSWVAAND